MSDIVIQAEGLSKRYFINHQGRKTSGSGTHLSEILHRVAMAPWRLIQGGAQESAGSLEREEFWALKDVSFEIKRGDVVGIIGRNGAGKSTLLKVLSRITKPTSGEIRIHGRVASLLEVGTGFHPELTGRENVYLNGAILGMTTQEIRAKFDEIVDFSGVERFLDTPVKHYSSGMYVRLAFAVAAHLEPEILVVDEVLAVGDSEFQKKCLGKMENVARSGRTVLFVSHSMTAIRNLTTRALVMRSGQLNFNGDTESAVAHYRDASLGTCTQTDSTETDFQRPSWARKCITKVSLHDADGNATRTFPMGGDITLKMHFSCPHPLRQPVMGVVINHPIHGTISAVNTLYTQPPVNAFDGNCTAGVYTCTLTQLNLMPGGYLIDFWLTDGTQQLDVVLHAARLEIEEADIYGTGKTPPKDHGLVFLRPHWELDVGNAPS
jgi:lipopolysaccharide transport system ATP-binding protein